MKEILVGFAVSILFSSVVHSQSNKIASQHQLYEVCGNPALKCSLSRDFAPQNLPFNIVGKTEMWGEYKSKEFYAVLLKSKAAFWDESPMVKGHCERGFFTESERKLAQNLFKKNKVFASDLGCYGLGQLYYTNSNKKYNFLAVYAGYNEAEANAILRTVTATGKFPGANVRKMQVVLCEGCH